MLCAFLFPCYDPLASHLDPRAPLDACVPLRNTFFTALLRTPAVDRKQAVGILWWSWQELHAFFGDFSPGRFFAGDSWMLQGQSQSTHRGLQEWESWWAPNLPSDRLPHSQGLPPASVPGGEQHGWGVMSWVSILHRAFTGLEDHVSNELLEMVRVRRSLLPLLLQDVPVTQRKGKRLISVTHWHLPFSIYPCEFCHWLADFPFHSLLQ